MKRPSIQLYPGDWLRDSVSRCSLAAQGLWLRMMIVAHDTDRYGYLSQNGSPIPSSALQRACGCDSLEQYESLLLELTHAGVPSVTKDGIIYSRRMVRDEKERKEIADRQARFRAKKTEVVDNKDDRKPLPKRDIRVRSPVKKHESNAPVTGESHPSSSSSSSESEREKENAGANAPPGSISDQPQSANRLPKTEKEAIAMAGMAGVPPDFATYVFQQHEGTSWFVYGNPNQPVTNFAHYVKGRWMKDQSSWRERSQQQQFPRPQGPLGGKRRNPPEDPNATPIQPHNRV